MCRCYTVFLKNQSGSYNDFQMKTTDSAIRYTEKTDAFLVPQIQPISTSLTRVFWIFKYQASAKKLTVDVLQRVSTTRFQNTIDTSFPFYHEEQHPNICKNAISADKTLCRLCTQRIFNWITIKNIWLHIP